MKASSFEENISVIEKILGDLEGNSLTMSDALEKYEKGILCTIRCQEILNKAALRVEQLNQRMSRKDLLPGSEDDGD